MSKIRTEQLAENVTLYCGDSAEVLPTIKRAKIDAVVTDPPYGISADRHRGSQANGWTDHGHAEGWDQKRPPESLIRAIVGLGKPTVIWGGNYFIDWLAPKTGGQQNKWLIWDKMQEEFSLADAELAWCSFEGAIRRIGVSRGHALQDGKEHPTQKSLKVMQWCIDQLPDPKKVKTILDPFMGSGTTGVAALSLGRGFIGIEREPHYFEVSLRRIKKELSQDKLF